VDGLTYMPHDNSFISRRFTKHQRKEAVRRRGRQAQLDELHAAYGVRFADAPGLRCADLFAGFGGFTTAIEQAGSSVLWSGNHWERAVEIQKLNADPRTIIVCQDLHQAAWEELPLGIDLVVASPACQGHSSAGRHAQTGLTDRARVKHDADRATAMAVISCLEAVRPTWTVTENVVEFFNWPLFDLWLAMVQRLGYETEILRLWAHHYGDPQARERVFVVGTRLGRAALDAAVASIRARVVCPSERRTVASFARFDEGTWKPSELAGAKGSRQRIEEGLALGVDQWWTQHVTGHKPKRTDTPLTTLTGADQHVLCRRLPGDRVEYRTLLPPEMLAVQGLPEDYKHPTVVLRKKPKPGEMSRRDFCRGVGNAISVATGRAIAEAVREVQAAA
jgi:DNA (cytosine-5)-methyltransferase 1